MEEISEYAGSDWCEKSSLPGLSEASPFGKRVQDLLGDLFLGIYHIEKDLYRADFRTTNYVTMTLSDHRDWSTYDWDLLTRLVFLAHRYCIRVEIQTCSPHYFRLLFHPRKRNGSIYDTHPTLRQAVEKFEERYKGQED